MPAQGAELIDQTLLFFRIGDPYRFLKTLGTLRFFRKGITVTLEIPKGFKTEGITTPRGSLGLKKGNRDPEAGRGFMQASYTRLARQDVKLAGVVQALENVLIFAFSFSAKFSYTFNKAPQRNLNTQVTHFLRKLCKEQLLGDVSLLTGYPGIL